MLPSKDMVDFVGDINKLFSRTTSNDGDSPFTYTSPFQIGNRSSSSADSISPESYFDLCRSDITPETRRHFDFISFEPSLTQDVNNIFDRELDTFNLNPYTSNSLIDTPASSLSSFQVRHPRPIVGRRILGTKEVNKNERDILQIDNQRNYELFPSENKGYEFTPIRNKTNEYNIANQSPIQQNMFLPKTYTQKMSNIRQPFTAVSTPSPSSSKGDIDTKMCTFCRKNGERPMLYMTHCVKEKIGNRHIVTCPILRSHECNICGASGDNAHTLSYCPVLRSSNNGKPLQSTTITLKNTRIKSNGKRRY